jgi:hypothetical protein
LVGVKTLQRQVDSRVDTRHDASQGAPWTRLGQCVPFFWAAVKCFVLVPIFPMAGYYLLDQTGVSHWLMVQGIIPAGILGEGFGHVGLCFSIHYVFTGFRELFRGFRLLVRPLSL